MAVRGVENASNKNKISEATWQALRADPSVESADVGHISPNHHSRESERSCGAADREQLLSRQLGLGRGAAGGQSRAGWARHARAGERELFESLWREAG